MMDFMNNFFCNLLLNMLIIDMGKIMLLGATSCIINFFLIFYKKIKLR
jgi:hypothetical protein